MTKLVLTYYGQVINMSKSCQTSWTLSAKCVFTDYMDVGDQKFISRSWEGLGLATFTLALTTTGSWGGCSSAIWRLFIELRMLLDSCMYDINQRCLVSLPCDVKFSDEPENRYNYIFRYKGVTGYNLALDLSTLINTTQALKEYDKEMYFNGRQKHLT